MRGPHLGLVCRTMNASSQRIVTGGNALLLSTKIPKQSWKIRSIFSLLLMDRANIIPRAACMQIHGLLRDQRLKQQIDNVQILEMVTFRSQCSLTQQSIGRHLSSCRSTTAREEPRHARAFITRHFTTGRVIYQAVTGPRLMPKIPPKNNHPMSDYGVRVPPNFAGDPDTSKSVLRIPQA